MSTSSEHWIKIFIFIFMICFVSIGYAKSEITESDSTIQNFKCYKKFSILFQIQEDFKFSDFQGSLISGKFHFSKNHALRFGIEFFGKYQESDSTQLFSPVESSSTVDSYINKNELQMQYILQYVYFSDLSEKIRNYYAIGPLLAFDNTFEKTGVELSNGEIVSRTSSYNYTISSVTIGVVVNFGLEFFLRKNIGLIAEYGCRIIYIDQSIEMKRPDRGDNYYHKIETKSDDFKLGISIYL